MEPGDRAWINQASANWTSAERDLLRLDADSPVPIYAIDRSCTYRQVADTWSGVPHGVEIALPGGVKVPLGPISFASPGDTQGGEDPYFAMSLPSVWRTSGVTSAIGLERLMDGVFLHERMHARQFYFANPALEHIAEKYGFGDDLSDDLLQEYWQGNPAYRQAYEAERDLLFAAAADPDDRMARKLAGEALTMMRARRSKFFTGPEAKWREVDDIFLTMEGLGQWMAYRWYVAGYDQPLAPEVALAAVRRKQTYWTQDEGLAFMLVVDRLVPNWQKLAFAEKPELAEALLQRAAGTP